MGVTALGALIMVALAYAAQSPRFLMRVGLAGHRLDLRVKTFTGLALAFLLLMVGFFLAGVPLGPVDGETAAANFTPTTPAPTNLAQNEPSTGAMAAPDSGAMDTTLTDTIDTSDLLTPDAETAAANDDNDPETNLTPASGAFGGPPATAVTVTATLATPSATPELAGPTGAAVTAGSTPAADTTAEATASPTPSATPTVTPSPTITPTPIDEDTAVINTNGSTLWLRRSPGGQTLIIVRDQELVIDRRGRANQGGILWHEIMTVSGVTGWVQEEFLDFSN